MDRRDFLKFQIKSALWLAAGASGLWIPKIGLAAAVPDIGVVKGAPGPATRIAVGLLGGMGRFVKPGNRVVIKPNMSFPTPPERASNTHPEVVAELAAMCKEAGASKVLVLDNPLSRPELCLEMSRIKEACNPIDEKMVYMVEDENLFRETPISGGTSLSKTDVMKDVLKSDVLIAAPVAKSHSGSGVSLSMKGMMGLIRNRRIMHSIGLHKSIVDLATLLKADLTVIDATRVLTTGGPGGPGKVKKENTVIASADMVAADAYTVSQFEWYGKRYEPRQVPHILEAHERGLGRMDVDNLTVKTSTV